MSQSYPPPRPPISRTDLAGSIAALVLTVVGGGAAAVVLGVFMMAFTDYCPAAACAAGIGGYLFAVGG